VTGRYRSLLDPLHDAAGARRDLEGDCAVVTGFGETAPEREQAFGRLAIMDLSPLPRLGLKGVRIGDWLEARGMKFSESLNQAVAQKHGDLLARLGTNEFLVLANPCNGSPGHSHERPDESSECYAVSRRDSHYWFALSGEKCPSMLAKLCGVDFNTKAFGRGSVAQTQVAKTSAIVIRNDVGEIPCYYLLGDNSCVLYMWACIVDAMAEFDGRKLGLQAIQSV
jgi:sarcosine oxidase subunit gamma